MQAPENSRLFGVVRPLVCESPTSWAQRVCQQYDLTYTKFFACFGIKHSRDIDLALTASDYRRIATTCGLLESDFFAMQTCFGQCRENRWMRDLVGRRTLDIPMYRYCPECWKGDAVPYLRLEWRFLLWRTCPAHRIALRVTCPSCNSPLQMQRAVLGGTVIPPPVASLAICLMCGADMRLGDVKAGHEDESALNSAIALQRAHFSALLQGYFMIRSCGLTRFPTRRLARWIEAGALTV